MTHAWCRDIPRDEAVRAAEDNRQGPLPTLEEAIATPFTKKATICESESAVEAVIPAADAHGGGGHGLRTERVTLEVTHNEFFPVSEWSWITMLRLRPGESVRVVEEFGSALPRVVDNMADEIKRLDSERDAAICERDAANERRILVAEELKRVRDRESELKECSKQLAALELEKRSASMRGGNCLAPPPARGWLTEEERRAVTLAAEQAPESDFVLSSEGVWVRRVLSSLIARSTPPEVEGNG